MMDGAPIRRDRDETERESVSQNEGASQILQQEMAKNRDPENPQGPRMKKQHHQQKLKSVEK